MRLVFPVCFFRVSRNIQDYERNNDSISDECLSFFLALILFVVKRAMKYGAMGYGGKLMAVYFRENGRRGRFGGDAWC